MNRRTIIWSRVAAALVVAVGIALVWGTLAVWTFSFAEQLGRANGQVYESLQVAMDGTPVIVSRSMASYLDATYRTIDGRSLPDQREEWLTGASLAAEAKPPRLWETSVTWPARIAGASDDNRPRAAWYVVRDAEPIGRAYLVGYDEFSKLQIGYIGRGGFRRSIPPIGEWFDMGRYRFDWYSGRVATTGYLQYGGRPVSYAQATAAQQRLPAWHLFMIDGDRLVEIDLRARTVRPVYDAAEPVSVASLLELRSAAAASAQENDIQVATEDAAAAIASAPAGVANLLSAYANTESRIALRTANQVIVLDPPTGAKREYMLPETARGDTLQVYAVGNEQLLVHWWNRADWPQQELMWLSADGAVARQETVTLVNYQGMSQYAAALTGSAALPIPIAALGGAFVGAPITMLQTNVANSYGNAVARTLAYTWFGLVIIVVVSAALAWWTLRLQFRYHRPATGVWSAFVLLLGVPGFIAYWLEHRRPKLEPCGACGKIVPRDREACAACSTLFPAPSRLGTEIFA